LTLVHPGGALTARAGERGEYEFRDLKPGRYRLLAAKSGFKDAAATVEVKKNGTTVRDFKLAESASAAVRKAVASGTKSGSSAKARGGSSAKSASGASSSKDKSASGAAKGSSSRSVRPGSPAVAKGEVRGTVLDAKGGKPLAGVTVTLKGRPAVKTDASGRFRFADLAPGSYSVSVKKAGFRDGSESFAVKSGGTTSVRIRLRPSSATKTAKSVLET
jgi:protocatechuate 3,4-dioxygenase beta subunit